MKKLTKRKIVILFLSCAVVFSLNATSLISQYDKAVELQQNENYYLASQYYLEIVAENPAWSDAWYNLSECSYKLGEFDLALQYLEKCRKIRKRKPKN